VWRITSPSARRARQCATRACSEADTLRARFLTHLVNGFVGLLNGGVARPVRALREAMANALTTAQFEGVEPLPEDVRRGIALHHMIMNRVRRLPEDSVLGQWYKRVPRIASSSGDSVPSCCRRDEPGRPGDARSDRARRVRHHSEVSQPAT
jgi:hypothetical protein